MGLCWTPKNPDWTRSVSLGWRALCPSVSFGCFAMLHKTPLVDQPLLAVTKQACKLTAPPDQRCHVNRSAFFSLFSLFLPLEVCQGGFSKPHLKKPTTKQRCPQNQLSATGRAADGICMGNLHPWGPAGSVFIPISVPVPTPGWWHGSQQARHSYAEAKGHFSELLAAAHLHVSLVTLRREDQVHRKRWDPPGTSKSAPESFSIETFPKSSSKMLAVTKVRKRSLWLRVGPVDIDYLV